MPGQSRPILRVRAAVWKLRMPRRRRALVECRLYHVYNRFARGEEIFADDNEAIRGAERIREPQRRHGFAVYAW